MKKTKAKFFQPTTKIHYGLRLIARIASANQVKKKPISLGVVAKNEKLSRKYLEELAGLLKKAKLISSVRGKQGGYILSQPANKINLKQIIVALDGPINPVICLAGNNLCSLEKGCLTKPAWQMIERSLINTLEKIDLEDLII